MLGQLASEAERETEEECYSAILFPFGEVEPSGLGAWPNDSIKPWGPGVKVDTYHNWDKD